MESFCVSKWGADQFHLWHISVFITFDLHSSEFGFYGLPILDSNPLEWTWWRCNDFGVVGWIIKIIKAQFMAFIDVFRFPIIFTCQRSLQRRTYCSFILQIQHYESSSIIRERVFFTSTAVELFFFWESLECLFTVIIVI